MTFDTYLDWSTNPNCMHRWRRRGPAIATYLQDDVWLRDRCRHVREAHPPVVLACGHQRRCAVEPIRGNTWDSAGCPSSLTANHWGAQFTAAPLLVSFVDDGPCEGRHYDLDEAFQQNGINAEASRDLHHVSMSMGSWAHAILNLRANGLEPSDEALELVRSGAEFHVDRVLDNLDNDRPPGNPHPPANPAVQVPPCQPVTSTTCGHGTRFVGMHALAKVLGDQTPASVNEMLTRPQVTALFTVGFLNFPAEMFSFQGQT